MNQNNAPHTGFEENLRRDQENDPCAIVLVIVLGLDKDAKRTITTDAIKGSPSFPCVSNKKMYDSSILRKHDVKRIMVQRTIEGCEGGTIVTTRNFEVPQAREVFPRGRRAGGGVVGKE